MAGTVVVVCVWGKGGEVCGRREVQLNEIEIVDAR